VPRLSGTIALPDGSTVRGRLAFDATISAVERAPSRSGDYVVPGFIDLQVNFPQELASQRVSAVELVWLAGELAREGVTGFLATAITQPLERLERIHGIVAEVMDRDREAGDADAGRADAGLLGLHLEGPFIARERLGAHPPFNQKPRGRAFKRILAMDRVRLVTLAPELPGALAAVRRLARRGIAVSLGHSSATLEQACAAVAAGGRMFTHLFNAMAPIHHRAPGLALAGLLAAPAYAAVIPDGVHLHPAILRLVYRCRGARAMLLTTDRVGLLAPAGIRGVPRSAASSWRPRRVLSARLGKAAALRPTAPRKVALAGSTVTMLDGFKMMVEKVGATVAEAALMAATNPAAILNLADRGAIRPGARADFVLLSHDLKLKAVFVGGREVG
jgi:N-acetylglucosamine-6-phosphate deacetylase